MKKFFAEILHGMKYGIVVGCVILFFANQWQQLASISVFALLLHFVGKEMRE